MDQQLIYGIISGFHLHDGSNMDYVSEKLSGYLNRDQRSIQARLSADRLNVLGKRVLVSPYRSCIKWNPADERVLYAEILIDDTNTTDLWYHEGQIYSLVI